MWRLWWAAGIVLVLSVSGAAAVAETLVSASCRQGECNRQYLVSISKNPDGTISAKLRFVFFNYDKSPADPPRSETAIVSCAVKSGYLRYPGADPVGEPPKGGGGPHATCEPDSLWSRVCGRRVNVTC